MRVSLGGITNSLFHNKLYGKRIYCKSESSWFMRTFFEKPIELYMEPQPVDSYYTVELNGTKLGLIEGYTDGFLFNLIVEDSNIPVEGHVFLSTHSDPVTLTIRDITSKAALSDYRGVVCTGTHKKHMPDYEHIPGATWTEYYRYVTFDWESKIYNDRGLTTIRNPVLELREVRAEMSELHREQSDQNLQDIRRMAKEMKEKYDTAEQKKPEESTPLPPIRNITICK